MGFRKNFIILIIAMLYLQCNAQSEKPTTMERIFVGGNLGLEFGTATEIVVMPQIGYRLTPRLSAGIGFTYEYYNYKYFIFSNNSFIDINTSIYGGSLFARYTIIKNLGEVLPIKSNLSLYAHVEDEELNFEKFDDIGNSVGRGFLNSFLVGGGIKQPLSERASINISILWDLNNSPESIYENPIIRFGFLFTLGSGKKDNEPPDL